MTGFSDQFSQYLKPSAKDIQDAIRTGIIVLDTNVLLSAYRFAPESRSELLNVLHLVKDRLWVPHQVALEFHRNRFSVIADHDGAYKAVIETLKTHRQTYEGDLEKKIQELANRTALTSTEQAKLFDLLKNGLQPLQEAIDKLRENHGIGEVASDDFILNQLQEIFSGKVGQKFSEEEEVKELEEARRRIENHIPPGYKDSGKQESHGDYFIWSQTLKEAKRQGVDFLVFVTGDIKEDWYLRVKGKTITARPELSLECRTETGAILLMMPIRSLLQNAESYLQATVSDETIKQADRISKTVFNEAKDLLELQFEEYHRMRQEAESALFDVRISLAKLEDHRSVAAATRRDQEELLRKAIQIDEILKSEESKRAVTETRNNISRLTAREDLLDQQIREGSDELTSLTARLASANQAQKDIEQKLKGLYQESQ